MVDTEKLISFVYERKPLWDVQSKNYHNRDVARKKLAALSMLHKQRKHIMLVT